MQLLNDMVYENENDVKLSAEMEPLLKAYSKHPIKRLNGMDDVA